MIATRSRRRAPNIRRIEVWRIIIWSGLTNLLLMAVYFGAQRLDIVSSPAVYLDLALNDKTLLMGSASWMPEAGPEGGKQDGSITASKSDFSPPITMAMKSGPGTDQPGMNEMPAGEAENLSTSELALAAGASVEDSEDLSARPILLKNPQSGKLEIGNFKSLSVVGSSEDCLDFGHSMLSDAGSANTKLDIMIAEDEITIARICAVNGSVIISCRGGQISVSPRKSRPDDRCAEKG